jgi:hypothetical protein
MKWIKLSDRKPDLNIDGEKVLVCRIVTKQQELQAISIMNTDFIKNCNIDETWWIALPELPKGFYTV